MRQVLLTGGTGYLGRHILALLVQAGRDVRVLARPGADTSGLDEVEVVTGDITNGADLERAVDGVGQIIHTAAETHDGRSADEYTAANVGAVTRLLDLARKHDVERVVHTSHYFAIGRTGEPRMTADHVADEYWTHDPGDMHDAHELSKYDAENEVNQRISLSEPVLALIPTMMYGPEAQAPGAHGPGAHGPGAHRVGSVGQLASGNRIVRLLAEHAAGRYPGIPADGEQIWNLVHVQDVAAGHLAVLDAEAEQGTWPPPSWGHWHYILGGENVSVRALFELFCRQAGCAAPRVLGRGGLFTRLGGGHPYKGYERSRFEMDSHSWAYTSALAGTDFGFVARPLEQGLAETVDWMRSSGLIS